VVVVVVVVVVVWEAKLVAALMGLAVLAIGVGLMRFGAPLIVSLNNLYARLPGRFQYPLWWHRVVGGIIGAIGLLIAVLGMLLAGR
jgi:hypothetical protein